MIIAALLSVALAGSSALAQLPVARLTSVFPLGGKQGTQVIVNIGGSDLDDASGLRFSHPGIAAKPKLAEAKQPDAQPQAVPNQFIVEIASDVPPGQYQVRAVGRYGVSNPRAFAVGDRAESAETEPNNAPDQAGEIVLGAIIDGQADGATPDVFKFRATAGARVLIECRGAQLDSQIDPTLVLLDVSGKELAVARRSGNLAAMIDFVPSADGEYLVRVFDFLYRGGSDFAYQLSIGTRPHIDFVFPPAGRPGTKASFILYGRNLPGSAAADGVTIDGRPLEKLAVEIDVPENATELHYSGVVRPPAMLLDGCEYRLQTPAGASNAVLIGYAHDAVISEQEPNDRRETAQRITIPCDYAGQFTPAGDQDWIAFDAKKNEVYWIEIFSQRLGAATDPSLVLERVKRDGKGAEQVSELRQEDDFAPNIGGLVFNINTGDPQYRFKVPDDGTFRLMLRDLYATGDPRSVYRLSIRREQADFRLVAFSQFPTNQPANQQQAALWSTLLRPGGVEALQVIAFRRDNFGGEIELGVEGLPSGVHAAPAVIGPGKNTATLVLSAEQAASPWVGDIRVVGRSTAGEQTVIRTARPATIVWPGQQNGPPGVARMAADLALAVGEETAPLGIAVVNEKLQVARGGKLQVPIKLQRGNDFKDQVTLNPIDLPPNVQVGKVAIADDKSDGELTFTVGNNAPLGTYTCFLRGDAKVAYRRVPEATAAAKTEKKSAEEGAQRKSIDLFVPFTVTFQITEKPAAAKK